MRTQVLLAILLCGGPLAADPAVIERIEAVPQGDAWRFSVTLSHGDTGWGDYADGWRVELEDGTIVGTRPLAHPHVEEQPFTRSQSGINIPDGVARVFVRASTNVDGWSDERVAFELIGG